MPKLSVCMATYNGGRWVREQLASILGQLAPDDEVVVSDDGSTDDTVAVVRAFGDPRVRVLEGNTFRSPARNFENALREARGELVALSDQDDVWLEGRVALIRERLAPAVPPVRLVAIDAVVTDERGAVLDPSLFRKIGARPGLLKNVYDNSYVGACLAFRRELLEVALPFPSGIPMHDMWLGLLAELFGTVEFVPVPLLAYRRHGANATSFERKFRPVLQIKRRWALATSLARRTLERRAARKG
jgi:glycosyltransferase involved in cell wall biosynthesis